MKAKDRFTPIGTVERAQALYELIGSVRPWGSVRVITSPHLPDDVVFVSESLYQALLRFYELRKPKENEG